MLVLTNRRIPLTAVDPTSTTKPRKWELHFPVMQKSENFLTDFRNQEILPKILENLWNFTQKYWKSEGILASCYFLN